MNNIQQLDNQNNVIIKISKGIVIAFLITLISVFLFSVILTYTDISEKIIPIAIVILMFISILIGTIISMRKTSKNGMLNGAIIGGSYVILLYLISSVLNTGFSMNIYTIIMIITGTIAGVIGGIISVNI